MGDLGVLVVVFWLLCAIVATVLGAQKNAALTSFVAGLLFGPLGILVVVISAGNTKRCPACRKNVDPKATICPYCRTAQAN